MKIGDVLPQLGIFPLRRFADAWDVRTIKSGRRDVLEQAILGDVDRIDTEGSVHAQFAKLEERLEYARRANAAMVLRHLLDEPGYVAVDQSELIGQVVQRDAKFVTYAKDSKALRHLDARTVDICQSILSVACEDGLTYDEYKLIDRLRQKLGVSRRDHLVLEARVMDRPAVTSSEIEEALRDLNYLGLTCEFRHQGCLQVVIPEELANHLRRKFGIVLQSGAYRNLANRLPVTTLKGVLKEANQPYKSISRDFLVNRLVDGDVSPISLLDHLGERALDHLLSAFPGQKRPRMRAVKIRHIISHFDRLAVKSADIAADDPDRTYCDYLIELATRQYDLLRTNNVIHRDQNVDRFFERGVRYIFRAIFGHPSLEFSGSAHADGGCGSANGRMALWDCKSALAPYALTEAKCAQFLQYIMRESPVVVSPFLVISGSFSPDSENRAWTLKESCPRGTEIGLLSADDLRWLADKWEKDYPNKRLPLEVLAQTGSLSRNVIQSRLKLFGARAEEME